MAKIISMFPYPVLKAHALFSDAFKNKINFSFKIIQGLPLYIKIYTIWRVQFLLALLKFQIREISAEAMKAVPDKILIINSKKKAHYLPVQSVRKGVTKMLCIKGGSGYVKNIESNVLPAAKVVSFK